MLSEIDPKYAMAFTNRGNAYLHCGDLDIAAISDYDEALDLGLIVASVYCNRGVCLRE